VKIRQKSQHSLHQQSRSLICSHVHLIVNLLLYLVWQWNVQNSVHLFPFSKKV